MKRKFFRVLIALVMVVSLSLVTAVPVAADITDPGGDGTAVGAPKLAVFSPQEVEVATQNSYTVTVEDAELLLTTDTETQTITDAVVINIPQAGGYALWTGTTNIVVTLSGTNPANASSSIVSVTDGQGNISVIKVTVEDTDATAGTGTTITGVTVTFDSTSTSTTGTYEWTVDMEDDAANTDTGVAEVVVVTEIGPPSIVSVAGTTYQNSNDVIVITFSKQVRADDGTFNAASEFTSIKSGTTTLTQTTADFSPSTGLTDTLTITLDMATDGAYLVNGETLYVTPAVDAIEDVNDYKVPITEATGSISGDTVVPTVVLTYSESRPVKDADTLTATATFSEDMADTPQIAIATPGDGDLSALDMTTKVSSTQWTYAWDVASGIDEDGTATVTITGTDLAGNSVGAHTTNTFVIDNTLPTIAVADIVGTTIEGEDDTIVITFSEAVTAEDSTWAANEFTSILSGTRALTLTNATFVIDATDTVLTITLNEATDLAYLVNGEMITVELSEVGGQAIQDLALNEMLSGTANKIVGTTAVSGDVAVPTIINIVGTDADTVKITFSEPVVPADEAWSSNEFALIENPDGAPINITNATATPDDSPGTGMAVELTIDLDAGTDDATFDITKAISVTPATGAIVDLAGNSLAAVEVSSVDTTTPTITSIVGTSIQDAGDTIVITFSEAVAPAEETPVWSDNELDIESPDGTGLTIDNATFSIDGTNTILTVTLLETEAYLVNEDLVLVTPAADAIEDASGNPVPDTEVESAAVVSGDTVAPTIVGIVATLIPGETQSEERDIIRIDFSEAVVPVDNTWSDNEFDITGDGVAGVDFTSATFAPASGITTTLTITLLVTDPLTKEKTLTVTPVADEVVDLAGNKMSDEVDSTAPVQDPTAAFVIDLLAGFNLISLPLVPTDADIEAVLAGLVNANTVIQVRTYNTSDDSWSEWASTGPLHLNPTLTEMNDGPGFWVEMSTGDNLVAGGSELPAPPETPPTYSVYTGWNLIGFKSLTASASLVAYLGTLVDGTREAIYSYDASTGLYVIPTIFEPGYGYWLAVNADGTIYP